MLELEDLDELRRQEAAQRRYRAHLAAHPHPQDPDYPGDVEDFPETTDQGETT